GGCCATLPRAARWGTRRPSPMPRSSKRSGPTPARPRNSVPFDFLKRKKEPAPPPKPKREAVPPRPTPTGTPVPFDGVTEEWRLVGQMYLDMRLSDALNRREALAIADVSWAPIDGSSSFSPVPGLRSVDPYDFIVVLADESSKGGLSEAERAAYMVQKVAYQVALEA